MRTDHLHLFAWSRTFVYAFLTRLQVFVYVFTPICTINRRLSLHFPLQQLRQHHGQHNDQHDVRRGVTGDGKDWTQWAAVEERTSTMQEPEIMMSPRCVLIIFIFIFLYLLLVTALQEGLRIHKKPPTIKIRPLPTL
jgi:hypothetical protein